MKQHRARMRHETNEKKWGKSDNRPEVSVINDHGKQIIRRISFQEFSWRWLKAGQFILAMDLVHVMQQGLFKNRYHMLLWSGHAIFHEWKHFYLTSPFISRLKYLKNMLILQSCIIQRSLFVAVKLAHVNTWLRSV